MKKTICLALGILLVSGSVAFAESKVKGVVVNKSNVKGAANVAIGKGNEANMGSLGIEDSTVKGVVVNKSNVKGAANVAIGKNNTANMGSTQIQDSKVKGVVVNKSNVKGAANVAIGKARTPRQLRCINVRMDRGMMRGGAGEAVVYV